MLLSCFTGRLPSFSVGLPATLALVALLCAPQLACPVALAPASEGRFSCLDDDDCAHGFGCIAHRCIAAGQDAGLSARDGAASADAGMPDAAIPDAEMPDAEMPDAAMPDAEIPDVAMADAEMPDAEMPDAAMPDAAMADAAMADTAMADAAMADAAMPDAAVPDAAMPDSAMADAAMPDAAMPDAVMPDSAMPDSAMPDVSGPCTDCWWDSDWGFRRELTFDNSDRAEVLVDFPVLVVLDDGRIDYGVTEDSGRDLRFVDADGLTVLAHEIEEWDETGRSFVWVKVPEIEAGSAADHIWMYYGHSSPAALNRSDEVWSAGYQAVYHLNGDLSDSTAAGLDGVDQGTLAATGVVAGGRSFDGSDDWIDLGDDRPFLRNVSAATLSAWGAPDRLTPGYPHLVTVSVNSSPDTTTSRALLCLVDNGVEIAGRSLDSEDWRGFNITSLSLQLGAAGSFYGVLDFANDRVDAYVNGAWVGGADQDFGAARTSDTLASTSAIGAQDNGTDDYYQGMMDEVRISTVARTAGWIAAQHQSVSDDGFISYGLEQPYSP